MQPVVRPARPEDPAAVLLYLSAAPYYDAYAGSAQRARRLLDALYPRPGHTASWEVCRVAELDGELAGVRSRFRGARGPGRPRRFLRRTLRHTPPWRVPTSTAPCARPRP